MKSFRLRRCWLRGLPQPLGRRLWASPLGFISFARRLTDGPVNGAPPARQAECNPPSRCATADTCRRLFTQLFLTSQPIPSSACACDSPAPAMILSRHVTLLPLHPLLFGVFHVLRGRAMDQEPLFSSSAAPCPEGLPSTIDSSSRTMTGKRCAMSSARC